jgi:hypothetical protein
VEEIAHLVERRDGDLAAVALVEAVDAEESERRDGRPCRPRVELEALQRRSERGGDRRGERERHRVGRADDTDEAEPLAAHPLDAGAAGDGGMALEIERRVDPYVRHRTILGATVRAPRGRDDHQSDGLPSSIV